MMRGYFWESEDMKALYVASTEPHSGKSGVVLCLGIKLKEQGLQVGFMKPLSTLPAKMEGVSIDEDAYFTWKSLECDYPLELVSPVALSSRFIEDSLQEKAGQRSGSVSAAFDKISKDKDVVLLEGAGCLHQGRLLGMSAPEAAKQLNAEVLLVAKAQSDLIVDEILMAKDVFGNRLDGVIFNSVPHNYMDTCEELIIPTLAKEGISVFGSIPEDKILLAVTVAEIAEHLNGEVLCAKEKSDELVEAFMVGAMAQEHALRYFRLKKNKAVITGGDRADIQLAALETSTKCLILTGRFQPSPIVLARAEELGVPMILVDTDTYTAVERMDDLLGRVGWYERRKIERMCRLMKTHVRWPDLYKSMGLSIS